MNANMSKLILTEKPSVAKDIARVLKISQRKEGYFEGNGYRISWAFGHLVQLADPPAYDSSLERWTLDQLPVIPDPFILEVQKDAGVQKQFETIQWLLKDTHTASIICATDAGREGELIFRHLYQLAGCEKPIQRLWISSQTDQAILDGFKTLKPGDAYTSLYHSALSRSEADWIIGINATRAYTCRFSRGQGVMSVGRVQTPVLKMIVDRYVAHQQFNAEPYHEIAVQISHQNGHFSGLWINDKKECRLNNTQEADAIVQSILASQSGHIAQLNKQSIQEKPPLLYDLTELQKDANKRFKFSADDTLKIMQALYEKHKVLTYPRTSSRYLSSDLKPKIPTLLKQALLLPDYKDLAQDSLTHPINASSRLFNDAKVTDHHAIIPTETKPNFSSFTDGEIKIYDLVIRRFLAGFMPDCLKDHTEILTQFGAHTIRSFGSITRQAGWRNAYGNILDDDKTEEREQALPPVQEKDPVKAIGCERLDKKTKAPALYTEAMILAAMETAGKSVEDEEMRQAMKNCGLGTPATRAQILERLIKVAYITREKNRLIPTDKGIQLISYIQDKALLSAELTGEWELKLNNIVNQTYSRDLYMKEIKQFAHDMIANVKKSTTVALGAIKDSLGSCPLCKGAVIDTKMAFSCSQWKATGCTFKLWKTIAKKEMSPTIAKELLAHKRTKVLKGFKSKEGNPFVAALVLQDDGRITFEFDDSQLESIGPCPLCAAKIIERKQAFGCENWRKTGCGFSIWKEISGKKITKTWAKKLLKKGESEPDSFKRKDGAPFEGKAVIENGRVLIKPV